jgi:hypothetical protein
VLPLSDGIPARRFPIVNVSIIVACFAVWLFYELPHLQSSVLHVFGAIVAWILVGAGRVIRPDGNLPLRAPAGVL